MKNKKGYAVCVVGATGTVGQEMLRVLEQRKFPVREIRLLASERSAGSYLEFAGRQVKVELLQEKSFAGMEIGLFSPGGELSARFAPIAGAAGCVVIDNTASFRMDPDVPLVVPEVNPEDIALYKKRNIIANPNCSTIQMVVVLKPIHDRVRIKRVVVSTYQATSGAGREAMEELVSQTTAILNQKEIRKGVLPQQIAFNLFPHIDSFLPNGYTKEEMKMVNETRKIMHDDTIQVCATTVRVPVFYGHSQAVNLELERKVSPAEIREILAQAPGVQVYDDPAANKYPMPILAAGKDDTFVGRIREDLSHPQGIVLWIVSDNIRKGAALNAVQIAEHLIDKHL
jgi:aspartate-semialdehyde dehydrogenase